MSDGEAERLDAAQEGGEMERPPRKKGKVGGLSTPRLGGSPVIASPGPSLTVGERLRGRLGWR